MKRFIVVALLSWLLVLGLGSLAHSQTKQSDQQLYDLAFQNKELIESIKQGYGSQDPAKPGQSINDVGVIFRNARIFANHEKLTVKITEDSGSLVGEQVVKKKEILGKISQNAKTGEVNYGFRVLYIEMAKGRRIQEGVTIELSELGYSQHFDSVPEAYNLIRTNT
jgi:hypothetical protein